MRHTKGSIITIDKRPPGLKRESVKYLLCVLKVIYIVKAS